MKHIEVVAGSYAIMEDRQVIGVVTKINETQWGFYPMVAGIPNGVSCYIPLQHALESAPRFEREQ